MARNFVRRIITASSIPRRVAPFPSLRRSLHNSPNPQQASEKSGNTQHGQIYKQFGRSFLKLFGISLAVYYGVYYSWANLERADAQSRAEDQDQRTRH